MPFTTDQFKAAMGHLASGVSIITMAKDGADHGFTATSFTSLSLDPMLVLVCVVKAQRSHSLIESSKHFAVHLLANDQKELGVRFASSKTANRFAGLTVTRAETGAPILPNCLAWLDCRLHAVLPGGDHSIFVGEVLAGDAHPQGEPLLYYSRSWGGFQADPG